jgi:hypothetical protein
MRTASVFVPRRTSQESNGERIAPTAFWRKASFSASFSSFKTTTPPTLSEWPFRYYVVDWSSMSTPDSMGRWR